MIMVLAIGKCVKGKVIFTKKAINSREKRAPL